jgi:hypothetical protein
MIEGIQMVLGGPEDEEMDEAIYKSVWQRVARGMHRGRGAERHARLEMPRTSICLPAAFLQKGTKRIFGHNLRCKRILRDVNQNMWAIKVDKVHKLAILTLN